MAPTRVATTGCPAGEGFEGHESEGFVVGWQNHNIGRTIIGRQFFMFHPSHKNHGIVKTQFPGQALQVLRFRGVVVIAANDHQPYRLEPIEIGHGFQQPVDSLDGRKPARHRAPSIHRRQYPNCRRASFCPSGGNDRG